MGIVVGILLGVGFALSVRACRTVERSLEVTVTAFNSVPSQTDSRPTEAAWGDRLEPGMKAVAVSRDLLAKGLEHGTVIRIEGLEGEYVVLDKTRSGLTMRVDVYMGVDVERAREFGIQQRRIFWRE